MSSIAERKALANACKSEEWSKAIRILDSIISKSFSAQDLCNRAFCYRQLELHKHTIKDCDKAIELNPTLLQAFILKGCALSSMGKIEDALCVWEHGYGRAASHCTDLKQILELEELLANAKLNGHAVCEEQAMGSSCTVTSSSESDSGSAPKSHRNDQNIEITSAIVNACESVGVMEKNSITIEPHDVGGVVEESSVISTPREGVMEKSSRARVSKTTSVFVDFRLSQGIAEANDSNMACGGAQDAPRC
ncbi:suppressor of RPS4-RLD 1 [Amborella trichopoda]|uniref:suppressor of RPS4-RLD 1 n=1 Tax=Amborella trichopoda TaxID=13333 RepID=UPI0009BD44B7|nr:suppressor of RPS4-RLD 1 [Amborella trichopoda]|eukprot:XP_011622446.2 suppressor of RPS4-RLD 1 [Amborella trichopoda]